MNTKERIFQLLQVLNIGQSAFEKKAGISNGYVNNLKGSIGSDVLTKIFTAFPELNIEWLISGKGEMLKPVNVQKIKEINENHGFVGQMMGGSVDIHHDDGKDMVIQEKDKEVEKMFFTLMNQVDGFQDANKRHDEHVKNQDEYLSRIIHNSYMRNERNMERIDELIRQQNKLLEMFGHQNERIQDRADKVIEILRGKQ